MPDGASIVMNGSMVSTKGSRGAVITPSYKREPGLSDEQIGQIKPQTAVATPLGRVAATSRRSASTCRPPRRSTVPAWRLAGRDERQRRQQPEEAPERVATRHRPRTFASGSTPSSSPFITGC